MVLDEGQVLDGKYVIVRVLATGSMGEVYLGRNERIGKEVAVKVLRRECAEDRAIVNRFEQEARIASAVKSSHVVDVYDLGELPSGERFIVMEYVEGESLGERMTREGKLGARVVGAITLQILDGLVAAHAAGVIHRDLKPENVILTKRDGQELVKLVDFGVSKRSEPGRDLERGTLHGTLLGTPMFMSPEQARGETDAIDHRTDIFSLGVSMYEALAGEVPFKGDNVVTLLSRIIDEEEIPLEKQLPGVDAGLARIVKKAMSKNPAGRYQTAVEMRDAVAEWQAMFASTSATRSSLEGLTRVSTVPPTDDDTFTLPLVGLTFNRKRARVAIAAAAVAAALTSTLMRHPAEAATDKPTMTTTTTAAATTAPTMATAPTMTTTPTAAATFAREPATPPMTPAVPLVAPTSEPVVVKKAVAPVAPSIALAARARKVKTPITAPATSAKAEEASDAGAVRDVRVTVNPAKIEEPPTPRAPDGETPLPDPPATPR